MDTDLYRNVNIVIRPTLSEHQHKAIRVSDINSTTLIVSMTWNDIPAQMCRSKLKLRCRSTAHAHILNISMSSLPSQCWELVPVPVPVLVDKVDNAKAKGRSWP